MSDVKPARQTTLKTPFLWAGSKDRDFPRMADWLPETFERYYEPFVGGGSVYFRLLAAKNYPFKAVISDVNTELMTVYTAMRDNPEGLISLLPLTKDRQTFNSLLTDDPVSMSITERGARFLYLNRNRFFGMGGWMNADRYARAQVVGRIRAFAPLMQKTEITNDCWASSSFAQNDLVFCDPPYIGTDNEACYGTVGASNITETNVNFLTHAATSGANFLWVTKNEPIISALAATLQACDTSIRVEEKEWSFRRPGQKPHLSTEIYIGRLKPAAV